MEKGKRDNFEGRKERESRKGEKRCLTRQGINGGKNGREEKGVA